MRLKLNLTIALGLVVMSCSTTDNTVHGIDSAWMNTSVNPGDDFFEYACGGWLKSHPIPDEYSSFGINEVLYENNRDEIKNIIEGLASSQHEKGSIEQAIADYYHLYLNTARESAEGMSIVKANFERIESLNSREEIISMINHDNVYGSQTILDFSFGADLENSKDNILNLSADGLTLASRDYYLSSDSAKVAKRMAFERYIVNMFCLAGCSADEADAKMHNVMSLETRMAKQTRTLEQLRDSKANYNKLSYTDFKKQFAGFDWDKFFTELGIADLDQLNVGQPETVREGVSVLTTAPLRQLKDWMQFSFLDDYASHLGTRFANEAFDFYGRVMRGKQKQSDLWKRAIDSTNGTFDMSIGKMYVERCFPEANKKRMIELVSNLQKALAQRIEAQEWMSDSTRQQAKEKLSTFRVKIGYPDKWRTYEGLTIDPSKSFVENDMNMSYWWHYDAIKRCYKKPVDRDEWYMSPQTINAYYDPSTNEICFPAGILQPPFFDMQADDAFNYGDIGATIGHEMIHGFDDEGSQFDKDGNYVNWWTDADSREFEKRVSVLADFFDRIEPLPGLHIKGRQVLGENIADHGGMKVAWLAYKEATKDNPLPVQNGLTADQRFFISYAFTWAQNDREEYIRNLIENDVHALPRYRVNACLPHIDAWYETFGIKEGDKLYVPKAERADIW